MSTLTALAESLEESARQAPDAQLRDTAVDVAQALRALAAVPAEVAPEAHPTGAQLEALGQGSRVLDATGDAWFKLPDGRWSFKNVTTSSSHHLVDVFGPVRVLGGLEL